MNGCEHKTVQVEHGLLHLERAEGCDEYRCPKCGEVVRREPCRCPEALVGQARERRLG